MSPVLIRSALAAAALSGLVLSAGGARADARQTTPSCAVGLESRYAAMVGRDGLCRPAPRGFQRRAALGAPVEAARLAVPSRYVSLLILGIGY